MSTLFFYFLNHFNWTAPSPGMLTVKITVCSCLMTNSRRQRSSIGIFPIFFPDLFAFQVVYLGLRGCDEDHCICKYSVILFPMHVFFVPSPWRFLNFFITSTAEELFASLFGSFDVLHFGFHSALLLFIFVYFIL